VTTLIPGTDGGRYPHGNSLLVRGTAETVLIDPALDVAAARLPSVDRLLISHCHEDHLATVYLFPDAPIHVHRDDRIGLESLDGLMTIYGLPPATDMAWRTQVVDDFHYVPRPDAITYADGDTFDVGGHTLQVIHLPGHTRGHSGFLIEPDGVMFLADIVVEPRRFRTLDPTLPRDRRPDVHHVSPQGRRGRPRHVSAVAG
jgi:glyoxylase-like metal-dependent hydrolase (beta-lactamase superfamily II)